MKQQWLFMFVRLSWCVAGSSLLSLPQVEVDIESHDHELLLTVRSLTACKLSEKQVDEALHVIFTFFFPLETLTDLTSPLFLSCMVPGVIMSLQWTAVATFLYIEVFFVLLLCIPFISPKRSEITSFFFFFGRGLLLLSWWSHVIHTLDASYLSLFVSGAESQLLNHSSSVRNLISSAATRVSPSILSLEAQVIFIVSPTISVTQHSNADTQWATYGSLQVQKKAHSTFSELCKLLQWLQT